MKTLTARLAILATALLTAASAPASYLLWQVDPTSEEDGGNTAGDFTYAAARIGCYKTSEAGAGQTLADLDGAGKVQYGDAYLTDGSAMAAPANFDVSSLGADYSYFIELVNYDTATFRHVAYGESLTYADLAKSGYVSPSFSVDSITVPKVWHGGSFTAAPEPTSAVLMAFGLAILGLKRRKC